jgi:hypothetical protein
MSREQQLEDALRNIILDTSAETLAAGYDLLNICRACDRDIEREGECSLCRDGQRERDENYRQTRIGDD